MSAMVNLREEGSGGALGKAPNGLSAARYCENCLDTVKRIVPVVLLYTLDSNRTGHLSSYAAWQIHPVMKLEVP